MGCLGCYLCRLEIHYWDDMVLLWAKSIRRFGEQVLCVCFGVWKARNIITFDDEVFFCLKPGRDFVSFLWSESKLLSTNFSKFF